MTFWSRFLLLIALITGLFGYSGLAGASAEIAKILALCFFTIGLVLVALRATLLQSERDDNDGGRQP